MPQFFVKSSDIINNGCKIEGEDFHHLRNVRRAKPGEIIDLRSDNGYVYRGRIGEFDSKSVTVEIVERVMETKRETDLFLTLYMSILKGKAFDLALQKAVEVGVNRIVPVITERTIPVLDKKDVKWTRWQKIAENAAKQSMRKEIPEVGEVLNFKEAIVNDNPGVKIIAHTENSGKDLKKYLSDKKRNKYVSLMIGPEGGFSWREISLAEENSWDRIVFGFTDLRAETACIVLPGIIIYEWGNFYADNS
ncbi:MAG: 16S rRNA (uracil(1498)-N(3))-methyltransferase [Spirochaetes bacterium]|nr:16S rRNA (uracil(1498)-N(3))-methyltransferase [Spirochaetota bacterium]